MHNQHPSSSSPACCKGFTLVELLVGVMVLSMLLISISVLYFAVDRIQHRSQDIEAAILTGEQQLESLRNHHYKTLDPDGDPVDFTDELPERLINGEGRVEVDEPEPGLRKLTVIIEYDERGSDGRDEVILSALIGRLGIAQ